MRMNCNIIGGAVLAVALLVTQSLLGEAPGQGAAATNDDKLEAISKKIDEQNRKIDLLSQEILKLEQQLANTRPGVMIGEGAPNYSPSPAPSDAAHASNGNSHIVARGETLTSIAKMYNVSVSDLQKYNHIENDRKLQIGQTLAIPASGGSAPAASASPSASATGQ
jgi:LysM repeat protein